MQPETIIILAFILFFTEVLPRLAEMSSRPDGPSPWDEFDVDDVLRDMRVQGVAKEIRKDFRDYLIAHRYYPLYRKDIPKKYEEWRAERAAEVSRTIGSMKDTGACELGGVYDSEVEYDEDLKDDPGFGPKRFVMRTR